MSKKLSNEALAYIAGIIDGEGSIALYKTLTTISVEITSLRTCEMLASYFPASVKQRHRNLDCKASYRIRWGSAKQIRDILVNTLPYLVDKKLQAHSLLKALIVKAGPYSSDLKSRALARLEKKLKEQKIID